MRPHHYWIAFLACLAVVLAAMGWVSAMALRLDRVQAEAQQRAAFEENVRLSLWRMETALVPLLARESSRPYFVYSSFYPAERAYTRMFEEIRNQDVLVPSPLLAEPAPDVILHFQIAPDGRITSPEVPSGRGKALSIATYSNGVMIATADRALSDLGQVSSLDRMLALLPANKPGRPEPARLIVAQNINAAANPLAENAALEYTEKQDARNRSPCHACPQPSPDALRRKRL